MVTTTEELMKKLEQPDNKPSLQTTVQTHPAKEHYLTHRNTQTPEHVTILIQRKCYDYVLQSLKYLQVLKSDSATVFVEELELTIPAGGQRGVMTTVEGLLSRVKDGKMMLKLHTFTICW